MIDNFDLTQLVQPLQSWFLKNKRVLPWRENPLPYYVWISEIMLQQTRVEAVKPYFDRFIIELPTIKALAECPEDKLLKLWEGLGYYNRVRNLKVAANQILEEYNGELPSDYKELLKLKGIGNYTAGAIASIAYGKTVPAVDGNVLRVISRVTADNSDIMKQSVRTHMEEKLLELMNLSQVKQMKNLDSALKDSDFEKKSENQIDSSELSIQETDNLNDRNNKNQTNRVIPQIFNQALMELGAMVCVPNGAPHCEECPWNELCEAKKQNRIGELPVKKKAKARRIEERTVLIIKDGEQLAIHKRPAKGLLAGLYELPNVEGYLTETQVISYLKERGYEPIRIKTLCDAKHIFSHVEWHMKGYLVFLQAKEYGKVQEDFGYKVNQALDNNDKNGIEIKRNNFSSEINQNPNNASKNEQDTSFNEISPIIDINKSCEKTKKKARKKEQWLFVDVEETKEKYAIPSAFVKYAEYLNLILGKDAIENKSV